MQSPSQGALCHLGGLSYCTISHESLPLTAQIPRVELSEMGPALDLSLHRFREATLDLAKEAHRQHKASKKKVRQGVQYSWKH